MAKFGVGPDKVVDVQALFGDSVDNVPGAPGIGVKTASALIDEYGDLDTLLERADEIKQNKRRETLIEFADQIRLSRELVRLTCDAPAARAHRRLRGARSRPGDAVGVPGADGVPLAGPAGGRRQGAGEERRHLPERRAAAQAGQRPGGHAPLRPGRERHARRAAPVRHRRL